MNECGIADEHAVPGSIKRAVIFTVLALSFSALYWGLASLAERGFLPIALGPLDVLLAKHSFAGAAISMVLRIFGPAVAAIITLYSFDKRAGLRRLWRSATAWRAPGWLYALALIGPLIASVIVVGIAYPLGLIHFAPDHVRPIPLTALFFLMLVFDGPLGEELGWRGLLLPQLLRTLGPISATLIVAIVWFAWHVPLYLADGKEFHAIGFLINIVGISFAFTWFYLKSTHSTFMAILLHGTTNFALFLIIKLFRIADLATVTYIYDGIVAIVGVFVLMYFWVSLKRWPIATI